MINDVVSFRRVGSFKGRMLVTTHFPTVKNNYIFTKLLHDFRQITFRFDFEIHIQISDVHKQITILFFAFASLGLCLRTS